MKLPNFIFSVLFFLSTLGAAGRHASAEIAGHHHRRPVVDRKNQSYGNGHVTKLFVFGDSYADTGNIPKGVGDSWKPPYGITFPGKPSGRFSDGRVLTDYVAKFYGLKSPLPYRLLIKHIGGYKIRYGVNFAYGGTGVFDTVYLFPNMTTQIDFFEDLLNLQSVFFTKNDLQSSLFLLSVAGNDYGTYARYATDTDGGLPDFATSTVNQIVANMKRLHGLGARKIAVTTITPIGCLPHFTIVSAFQNCNDSKNRILDIHNSLLSKAVAKLNDENKDSSFIILDLFASFTAGFLDDGDSRSPGNLRFETPLKPCCIGIRDGYFCGSVDDTGKRMYTICEDRESAFFWDDLHPTQAGWNATYNVLRSTLQLIQ